MADFLDMSVVRHSHGVGAIQSMLGPIPTVGGQLGSTPSIPGAVFKFGRVLGNGMSFARHSGMEPAFESVDPVVHQHGVRTDSTFPSLAHSLKEFMPIFIRSVENSERINALQMARTTNVYSQVVAVSLPSMNRYLRSEEGRRAYGGLTDCSKFCNQWKLFGVQQTVPHDAARDGGELAINMYVGKRARVPNIWAFCRKNVQRGDRLYIIFVRRPFQPSTPSLSSRARREAQEEKKEFEWKWEPYVSSDGAVPPAHLYITKDFIGTFKYIGVVTDVHGTIDPVKGHAVARDVVTPSSDLESFQLALNKLPHIDVQLFVCGGEYH